MTQQLAEPPTKAAPATNWTWPIRGVTAIIAVVLLFFGTVSTVGYFMLQTDTKTAFFTVAVNRVQVNNTNGQVVIRAGSGAQGATVVSRGHSSFRTAEHSETVTNGVLQVNGSCQGGLIVADRCSVDFEITVPPGTAVNAIATTGDISVLGTGGPVTARSSTGDLLVDRVGGDLRLTTNVGDVEAVALTGGTVTARSNTGDLRLDFTTAPDRIKATTNVGDVRVEVPAGATTYRVSAEVDVGDRHIDVPTDPASPRIIELSSNTGDVRMGLGQ